MLAAVHCPANASPSGKRSGWTTPGTVVRSRGMKKGHDIERAFYDSGFGFQLWKTVHTMGTKAFRKPR